MSGISFQVNSQKFFKSLDDLQFHYGLNKEKVMKYGMVKLIDRLFDFMPSKTKGVGVKAIRKDFSEQFVDEKYFETNFVSRRKTASSAKQQDKIRQYFANGEFDKLRLIQQKAGGLFQDIVFKEFDNSDIHRNTRGRIQRNGRLIMVTNPEALKEKIKDKNTKVGRLKGSFIPARDYFGEGVGASTVPKWIKSNSEGYFNTTGETKSTLILTAGSNIGYGQLLDQEYSLINRVYSTRARDFESMVRKDVLNKSLSKTLA